MKTSATYWATKIEQLTYTVKHCKPCNIPVFQKALRDAKIELNKLKRKAGVYV